MHETVSSEVTSKSKVLCTKKPEIACSSFVPDSWKSQGTIFIMKLMLMAVAISHID